MQVVTDIWLDGDTGQLHFSKADITVYDGEIVERPIVEQPIPDEVSPWDRIVPTRSRRIELEPR